MIHCGTDILKIDRIKKSLENPRFLTHCFTKREIAFFESKKNAPQTIAVNFAAKEAFSKALGTGVRGFNLVDIEVLRSDLGKPILHFYGKLSEIEEKYHIDISLSHSEDSAIAFVVLLEK